MAGAGHACRATTTSDPIIDWSQLHNPIFAEATAGVKDQALIWVGTRWHLLFSEVTADPTMPSGVRWNIASATSPDLVRWSASTPWPRQAAIMPLDHPLPVT